MDRRRSSAQPVAACMGRTVPRAVQATHTHSSKGVHGIRYQVKDVAPAAAFYTDHLGFTLRRQQLPPFARVALGDVLILLRAPGASGSRSMPSGLTQEPSG